MTYDEIEALGHAEHLRILGGLAVEDAGDFDLADMQTLLLLGPDEPNFWPAFQASEEYHLPQDPLDSWSKRVIGTLAKRLSGRAIFPSDGPPYPPFFRWALATGRSHSSPVNLLVHDHAGLMVSFRGVLALPMRLDLPPNPASPCQSCATRPCVGRCPVGALTPAGYDVARCKTYLRTKEGQDCMQGCAVRRACPQSQSFGRLPEQSAFHMAAFLGD